MCIVCNLFIVYFSFSSPTALAAEQAQERSKAVYTCPMHPDYVSDKPGSCPICGMDLVKKAAAPQKEHKPAGTVYTCPMHPDYTSDRPGSCPICGMDLVKKQGGQPKMQDEGEGHVHGGASPAGSAPAHFQIDPEKQQLIGVRTGTVEKRYLVRKVRATARVVIDPELYDAQTKYLGSDIVNTVYWNPARQKLLMLGMSEEEINDLKKRRWADYGLLAYVPAGSKGFYRAAYPDTAWVYASVFEDEMHWIKPGDKVTFTSPAFPGEAFTGEVAGVAQTIDPASRTARVRIRMPDPERRFHPEMFLTATILADMGEKLAVPEEAVMDSGTRTIVHVVKGGDIFEPREVKIGLRASGYYEVLSGLAEGEELVVSGNFLVDSESRLKGVVR